MTYHKHKYFWGETASCVMCGVVKTFHPRITSHWTVLEVDYVAFYVCDKCIPVTNKRATSAQFKEAYEKVGIKIAELLDKRGVTK